MEARAGTKTAFQAYRRPLTNVEEFKYFGCLLTSTDDNCVVVVSNLHKAQNKWEQMYQILVCEGENA